MIDYIALTIGHGLLAIALLRLFSRDDLDVDPVLDRFKQERRDQRATRKAEKGHRHNDGKGNAAP